ncbi:MAG: DUF1987 domain-containing protein [Bacteroidales bacterium]
MDNLIISGSNQTPTIKLQRGLIEISGRSIPEDPVAFYKPVMEWLNTYVENLPEFTQINLQFEYINTSSSKALHNILKTLNDKCDESHKMEINWFYEEGDDDMFELGQFFEPYLRIPIKYIETEE